MRGPRFQPGRYQLRKEAVAALKRGHPWVFRDKVSSAIEVYPDGAWLKLVDGQNQVVGYGLYQARGAVAIRVLRKGLDPPDLAWFWRLVEQAHRRRLPLLQETDAYRLLDGENDGVPGVVLDVYGSAGVLQTYTAGVDGLGRYLAGLAASTVGLTSILWKTPTHRPDSSDRSPRMLRGERPHVVRFHEGPLHLAADPWWGQKSGAFLDLRGLRRHLLGQPLDGARVLNLFSYTGATGLACCQAGAREVLNVDQAQPSLDFGRRYHKAAGQRWICADIFGWLQTLPAGESFDLIVVDPPSMATRMTQVPKALATYRRLYAALLPRLRPGGRLIGCCCTSRISRSEFDATLRQSLPGLPLVQRLPMELDHKPRFKEADYLKILCFSAVKTQSARPRRS